MGAGPVRQASRVGGGACFGPRGHHRHRRAPGRAGGTASDVDDSNRHAGPQSRRPGFANSLTGVAFQDAELSTKRLDLLRQLVPNLVRIAIVWNDADGGIEAVHAAEAAAQELGIQTLALEIAQPADLTQTVAKAKAWRAQGVVQLSSPVITRNRKLLLDALAANRVPATCEMRMYVAEGCLMTYSASYPAMLGRLSDFVDRVLKGAKPGDLPTEQPREFDFVVNLTTAQALGLTVPSSLRVQTTEMLK